MSGWLPRQHVTCRYKCAEACFHDVSNTSAGEYFGDIAAAVVSRRTVLHGAAISALALVACGRNDAPSPPSSTVPGMKFTAVAANTQDAVVIPDGYQQSVVIRWGDPVVPGAPAFDVRAQSAAAQRQQFGFNNDFAALLPMADSPGHFMLVVNHEYTSEPFMFYGYDSDNPTREQFEVGVAAHGLSVVEVQSASGANRLTPVMGRSNRRITADTPIAITGPAAGSPLLKTTADPTGRAVLGTLNNCGGGVTPWGTVLSAEENFNQYFGAPDGTPLDTVTADRLKRYGIKPKPTERKWERFDPRFDVSREPQEPNRFGYVIEVNPFDPQSTPVKHTAMGRLKHEAANVYVTPDGSVVTYSGDDERFEYMYKFVSSRSIQPGTDPAAVATNMTILDEGTLYVGKFSSDVPAGEIDGSGRLPSTGSFSGRGTWIPLLRSRASGAESMVAGMTPDEVAVFTRFAADRVGATRMDRPEDFETNPATGIVYAALTNNSERGLPGQPPADAANPRNENKNGQIIEIRDEHTGTSFTWSLLLVCGDPRAADTYYGGFDKSKVSPISCPDNLAFDSHGNLWIATDGNALKSNDGLFAVALERANRGETRQFLTVPVGAETCGPVVTDDFVMVCVQHPGEGDKYSLERPLSHWPDGGQAVARPAVVVVWKTGGSIGM